MARGSLHFHHSHSQEELHEDDDDHTPLAAHFMNVLKSFVGSNFLAIPHAFSLSGIVVGPILMCFIGSVTAFCCVLLVRVRMMLLDRGVNASTYSEVAEHVFGRLGFVSVEATVMFTQFGYCVGYLIFMSSAVESLATRNGETLLRQWQVVLLLCPLLISSGMIRDLSKFAWCSMLANIALLTSFILIMTGDILKISSHGFQLDTTPSLSRLPLVFGVLVACYEGIATVLPVEGSMKSKRQQFPHLLTVTLVGMTTLYSVFAILGAGAYGSNVCSVILDNLDDSARATAIKICILFGLFFTYTFQLFPVLETLDMKLSNWHTLKTFQFDDAPAIPNTLDETLITYHDRQPKISAHSVKVPVVQFLGIRVFVVLFSAGLAIGIPLFEIFISLVGSLGASYLAFIMPCLIALELLPVGHAERCTMQVIVLFGVVVAIVGTAITLQSLIAALMSSSKSCG